MSGAYTNYENFNPSLYSNQEDGVLEAAISTPLPEPMNRYLSDKSAALSVAVLGPNDRNRREVTRSLEVSAGTFVQEYSGYPGASDVVSMFHGDRYDAVVIELDSDPEDALDLVENICANSSATVMVYSEGADPELLVRCMRAGAREFLTLPSAAGVVEEALARVATRRPVNHTKSVRAARLLVFMGAKGGVGVTSVACNFAVALAREESQKTLLIDLDLPLGDAALNLGISSEFSTITALESARRLDSSFFSTLLVKHSSGLWVLAAPGRFPHYEPTSESIERLIAIARQEFDNVVVDMGSRLDPQGTALFRDASTVYLVTQAGIPELRNANRLINQVFSTGGPNLEIVLNRFESRTLGVSEEHIVKALTRDVKWKIPNDHALVRKMQVDATPLVLNDNPLSRVLRQMADSVNGKQSEPIKKKRRGLFG